MTTKEIKQLLAKFEDGKTTADEEQKLRGYFERKDISEELSVYAGQFEYFSEMKRLEPSEDFDPFSKINFDKEKESAKTNFIARTLRVAAGFVLLIIGFSLGLLVHSQWPAETPSPKYSDEIQQMSAMLLYNQENKATASERISAVNISAEIPVTNRKIISILIRTMNTDDNENVQLAAAEALFRFHDELRVQTALVNALQMHENPMMQITLINMLVEMKQESAIGEMQQMLAENNLRPIVKERLQQGIQLLKFEQSNSINSNT